MPYVKKSGVTRLKLPSDPKYWVEMRDRARYGDVSEAAAAAVQVSQVDLLTVDPSKLANVVPDVESGKGILTEYRGRAALDALVLRLITAWNLTDEHDEPLPINEDSLAILEPEDGAFLVSEARKRQGKTADGPFEKPSAPSSSDTTSSIQEPSAP
jgi:hypothetical protein